MLKECHIHFRSVICSGQARTTRFAEVSTFRDFSSATPCIDCTSTSSPHHLIASYLFSQLSNTNHHIKTFIRHSTTQTFNGRTSKSSRERRCNASMAQQPDISQILAALGMHTHTASASIDDLTSCSPAAIQWHATSAYTSTTATSRVRSWDNARSSTECAPARWWLFASTLEHRQR